MSRRLPLRQGWLFFLGVAACCTGCRRPAEEVLIAPVTAGPDFQTVTVIPEEQRGVVDLYRFVDSVAFIPLETGPECLIGKVEKLIPFGADFYICDPVTSCIFRFSGSGRFRYKIDLRSPETGRWTAATDVTVGPADGSVYVYDGPARTVFRYDSTGRPAGALACPAVLSSLAVAGRDTLLCYSDRLPNAMLYEASFPEQCRFSVLHGGKTLRSGLPCTYREEWLSLPVASGAFSRYNDTLLLTEYASKEIYTVAAGLQLLPRYRIEFAGNRAEFSFEKTSAEALSDPAGYFRSPRYSRLENVTETDRYLFIVYTYRGYLFSSVYDKAARKTDNIGMFWLDTRRRLGLPVRFHAADSRQGRLYRVAESGELKGTPATAFLPARTPEETDNPVIIEYFLKE